MKKLLPIVLLTLLAFLLTIIKIEPPFIHNWMNPDKNETNDQVDDNVQKVVKKKNRKHRDPYVQDTFPFKLKEKEEFAKKYPDQFNIVKKCIMLGIIFILSKQFMKKNSQILGKNGM